MWLEEISINLQYGWRTTFRESKVEKILFNYLFILTIESLSFCCCLEVIFPSVRWWDWEFWAYLLLSSDLIIWLYGRVAICSWFLLLNFQRYNCMGIRPAISSISMARDIQNVLRIHTAAYYYILLSTLKECNKGTFL